MNVIPRVVAMLALGSLVSGVALAGKPSPQTSVDLCSTADVSGTGVNVSFCDGYLVGNLNRSGSNLAALQSVDGLGSLGTFLQQTPELSGASRFSFAASPLMPGEYFLGLHWGGGKGGGDTAFYRLSLDTSFEGSFDAPSVNPHLHKGGLSNAALYSVSLVPEPHTYSLILAGLVAVGFLARRRKAE